MFFNRRYHLCPCLWCVYTTFPSSLARERRAKAAHNAPINIVAPENPAIAIYGLAVGPCGSKANKNSLVKHKFSGTGHICSFERINLPPAIGGPVRVESDTIMKRNPRREPMSSGGKIWAVHAGYNPMIIPSVYDCE
jgi:hypothetical protein